MTGRRCWARRRRTAAGPGLIRQQLWLTALHNLTATATDVAGNTSAASTAMAVTIDTSAPNTPVITSNAIVNTNEIALTGTAEANSTVKVYDGATLLGTVTANGSGAWTYTTAALVDGAHNLTATATDAAGNTSLASQYVDPTIGTVAPATVITVSVSGDDYQGSPQFRLLVDGKQIGEIYTVTAVHSLGQWETVTFDLASSILFSNVVVEFLNDAWGGTDATDRNLYVDLIAINGVKLSPENAVYDRNGMSEIQGQTEMAWGGTLVFDVAGRSDIFTAPSGDTVAPTAPTIVSFSTDSGVVGDHITNDNTLTLTGSAEANSSVKVYDGATLLGTATANGSGAWTYTTAALVDGAHNLTATATDVAGNTSAASTVLNVAVDTHAPVPVFNNLVQNTNGTVTLSGTSEANSILSIYDGTNSTPVGTVTTNADGTWSLTTGKLSNTIHNFTLTAVDVAGNIGHGSGVALYGSTSNDKLNVGPGNDLVMGRGGSDTFIFGTNLGKDVITDFQTTGSSHDVLQFSHNTFSDFAAVLAHAAQVGSDTVITVDAVDTVTLKNVQLSSLQKNDVHIV